MLLESTLKLKNIYKATAYYTKQYHEDILVSSIYIYTLSCFNADASNIGIATGSQLIKYSKKNRL